MKTYFEKIRKWTRLHRDIAWLIAWWVLFIIFHIIAIYFSIYPMMIISETALYQVAGIGAQIVAGLYGITLTGYIFFLEHLQQRKKECTGMEDVVDALKQRYHTMVKAISIMVVTVVIFSIFLMIYGTENSFFPEAINRFLVLEDYILTLTTTGLIVYFVMNVVDPNKIQKISYQYKEKISSSEKEQGDVKEFLKDYSEMKRIFMEHVNQTADVYQIDGALNEMRIKDILMLQNDIKDSMTDNIIKLTQYHSYLLFSQDMMVSKEMCLLAKTVKNELVNKNKR